MKKKWLVLLTASFISLASLTGCQSKTQTPQDTAENEKEQSANTGEKVQLLYSQGFTIENLQEGIKRVTDGEGREMILVPRILKEVPKAYQNSLVVRTPVQNAVFLSSTQVCALGDAAPEILESVGGIQGDASEWETVPSISERLKNGSIKSVGGYGEPDYEIIQSLNPDIVFVYTGISPQTDIINKLNELKIPYAVDNDYMESDYLARMEWIRFILTFYNADDMVNEKMVEAEATIAQIKADIKDQPAPKAAVFSVNDGMVYATMDTSWVGAMLKDLGCENVFSGLEPQAMTLEEAYNRVQEADVIIYTSTPTYTNGIAGIKEQMPQIVDTKAYVNDRIYQYDERFWNSIDQTHQVAKDCAALLYPQVYPNAALTYYVKVEK